MEFFQRAFQGDAHIQNRMMDLWRHAVVEGFHLGGIANLHIDILVGGWATPLKNMKVSWDDYSQYMGT